MSLERPFDLPEQDVDEFDDRIETRVANFSQYLNRIAETIPQMQAILVKMEQDNDAAIARGSEPPHPAEEFRLFHNNIVQAQASVERIQQFLDKMQAALGNRIRQQEEALDSFPVDQDSRAVH